MPEPQIVIVVNSLTEAHKLERELVRDRQNACGYRPRQAARGICNDFETNIPGERTNDSAGVA